MKIKFFQFLLLFVIIFSILLVITGCEHEAKTVSLSISIEGNGIVSSYPNGNKFLAGDTILLFPNADEGWVFEAWKQNDSIFSYNEQLSLTVDENLSLTALFVLEPPLLSYRLEAKWESYEKNDRLLNISSLSLESKGRSLLTKKETLSTFQIANYLKDGDDMVKRERAILIKYSQDKMLTSSDFGTKIKRLESLELTEDSTESSFVRMVIDEKDYDTIPEIIENLRAQETVEFAEEDVLYKIHFIPNDPLFSFQWNMTNLGMPAVWDLSQGDESVVVAIIDTGVYFTLADLNKTTFKQGFDFVNNSVIPFDDNGHGSHVIGTIAQSTNNEFGVAGMASNVVIMPIKVLASDGYGFASDIAQGIIFAVNNGADIINMSLGGGYSTLIYEACEYATEHGVLVVASTGNDGEDIISYPAALSSVMSVGAVNDLGEKTSYSNYGDGLDVMAPGGDFSRSLINSVTGEVFPAAILQETYFSSDGEGFWYFAGTSMAAPHVCGLAALLKSKNPSLSPLQIRNIITSTADDKDILGYDTSYGFGIINPVKALQITPYVKTDSIDSKIEMVSGTTSRWRFSVAESKIQASLSYEETDKPIILRLEETDGTILEEASGSEGYLQIDYDLEEKTEEFLWLTVSVGI